MPWMHCFWRLRGDWSTCGQGLPPSWTSDAGNGIEKLAPSEGNREHQVSQLGMSHALHQN